LNTAVSTVLAVLVLYLFGSPAIRDFMLALLIGLTVGTYSSAFLATPLWAIWKTAEENKGRTDGLAMAKGN
jgi:preprotein translocase subunit SecF